MVNWDGIEKAKDDERQRLKDYRDRVKEARSEFMQRVNRWFSALHDEIKRIADAKNAESKPPFAQIRVTKFDQIHTLQITIPNVTADLNIVIDGATETADVSLTFSGGTNANGSPTDDNRHWTLTPDGAGMLARVSTGFDHGKPVAISELADELLSALWYYAR